MGSRRIPKRNDQGAHFNLRPIEKPRNGKVPGAKEHYSFKEEK
ncbi:HNH/endonuclease VII fold putative polymorphic toxin [Pseudomonas sp. 1912-s]|nr:HNH/endonuclease VII fold putative polymorphic toxin [Pseudomonas sp. 1912-s]MDF3202092.1 HNH/endonuclease VII fold putative polymorphic toxin [Pseudomonas sp. 1912-s]